MEMTEQQIIETLATKVMGWETRRSVDGNVVWVVVDGIPCKLWNPLQNIADAWQVVEKLVLERGISIEMQSSIREFRVSFNGEDWTYGDTAQEAISKAALLMI